MSDNFEDKWRNAFEDASESPPDSVWAKIESRLNEENDRLPLLPWWNRFLSLGNLVAAAVGLILVASLGWWLNQSAEKSKITNNAPSLTKNKSVLDNKLPRVSADNQAIGATELGKSNLKKNKIDAAKPLIGAETNANKRLSDDFGKRSLGQTAQSRQTFGTDGTAPLQKSDEISLGSNPPTKNTLTEPNKPKNSPLFPTSHPISNQQGPENIATIAPPPKTEEVEKALPLDAEILLTKPPLEINFLSAKDQTRLVGIGPRQLNVVYDLSVGEKILSVNVPKARWASLSLAPHFFNSHLQTVANSNTANFAGTQKNVQTGQNQAAFSYSIQLATGFEFKNRWSLETGIGYLRGNSVYEDLSFFDQSSNLTRNSLEVSVAQSPNTSGLAAADAAKSAFSLGAANFSSTTTIVMTQTVHNQFSYLQIPLQLGYAVLKRDKLSLWLLGGFSNQVLLNNQFENGENNVVSFGSGKGPFRTFSVAASTGLRLQYRFFGHWSGILTGNYQQTLGNTTRANATFSARPQWWGLGWGLRYQF